MAKNANRGCGMRNRVYLHLAFSMAAAGIAWWAGGGSRGNDAYTTLSGAEASGIVGGQYTCPSQSYNPFPYCVSSVGQSCQSQPHPQGGQQCVTPPGGGKYACNYNCTKAGKSFPGNTYVTHATVVNPPCPGQPSWDCATVWDPMFGTWRCLCLQSASTVNCAALGNYQDTGTCARY
jgi:hypothetical protein